ncbi:MAG: hypothetical protein HC880_22325 [Bacteroidia bacterium]|nr:hypothetical protein [Bacteroidia bacterium]
MDIILTSPNESLNLTVTHADNQVVAFLNGSIIYNRSTEGNPTLNDVTPIPVGTLPIGNNLLTLVGVNWGGPYNFQGSIGNATESTPFVSQEGQSANGLIWTQSYIINVVKPSRLMITNNSGQNVEIDVEQNLSGASITLSAYDAAIGGNVVSTPASGDPITITATHPIFYLEVDHQGTEDAPEVPDPVVLDSSNTSSEVVFDYGDPERDGTIKVRIAG